MASADAEQITHCWQAYLGRFDLEHTFCFWKQTLDWTTPKIRSPQAGDRWTWLVNAAHTQLRGVVKYHVPWAGHAATLLGAEQKGSGVVLVAAALFGYALWQLVGAARDRGGRPAGAAAPVSPQDARTEQLSLLTGGPVSS